MNKVRPQIHAGSGQGQVGIVWTQVEGGDVESRFSKATYFPLCPQQTHVTLHTAIWQHRTASGWAGFMPGAESRINCQHHALRQQYSSEHLWLWSVCWHVQQLKNWILVLLKASLSILRKILKSYHWTHKSTSSSQSCTNCMSARTTDKVNFKVKWSFYRSSLKSLVGFTALSLVSASCTPP